VGYRFTLLIRQTLNVSLKKSQSLPASLITAFKEQLKAKANPQQGTFVVVPAAQMFNQSGGIKLFHCGIESSDSRQDQRLT
tara:strand:- start:451 stop:693 length:243 start_codon:yes stop_codon:yes gene_type:complete